MKPIAVTYHAIDRWQGRCRQPVGPTVYETRDMIREAVEEARPAEKLEARCFALYVMRARSWANCCHHRIRAEEVLVNDGLGLMFFVRLESPPVVVTVARVRDVLRAARGVQGSKLRRVKS